ncbi:hypothetical protein DFH08DRAFT_1084219 [Mycena albidolilacea]|uniref:Uncharacterized protein n=1 Tax=Mycena albidolilacea TaxID=1033008 RepID=A0AAD7EKU8_9AGAR|nr:hypothetical protein DFH08DRAFT_1084219 [Mycena albidolilacea]
MPFCGADAEVVRRVPRLPVDARTSPQPSLTRSTRCAGAPSGLCALALRVLLNMLRVLHIFMCTVYPAPSSAVIRRSLDGRRTNDNLFAQRSSPEPILPLHGNPIGVPAKCRLNFRLHTILIRWRCISGSSCAGREISLRREAAQEPLPPFVCYPKYLARLSASLFAIKDYHILHYCLEKPDLSELLANIYIGCFRGKRAPVVWARQSWRQGVRARLEALKLESSAAFQESGRKDRYGVDIPGARDQMRDAPNGRARHCTLAPPDGWPAPLPKAPFASPRPTRPLLLGLVLKHALSSASPFRQLRSVPAGFRARNGNEQDVRCTNGSPISRSPGTRRRRPESRTSCA